MLFICTTLPCYAAVQDKTQTVNNSKTPEHLVIEKQNEHLKEQVKELKIKNELIDSYQSSILSTVYWALSFLGSLAVLLSGFSWWSNSRLHQKDKDNIKNETVSLVTDFESKWNAVLSEVRREDNIHLESRIEEVKAYITKEVDSIKLSLKDANTFATQLSEKINLNEDELSTRIEGLHKSDHLQEAKLRVVEQAIWDSRGLHGNVLITQTQAIESAISAKSDSVGYHFERMVNTLNKVIDEGYICSQRAYDIVVGSINRIENQEIYVNQILELMNKLKVERKTNT